MAELVPGIPRSSRVSDATQAVIEYFSPCVANETNPYSCYLERLDFIFYPPPARGYKARLIVLLVCCCIILVLTLLQMFFLEVERRRNGRPWWIWRWVRIESTPFLVSHQVHIAAYSVIVAVVVNVAYIVGEWKLTFDHGSQSMRAARRATAYFPPMIGGMFASFSLLQAFIVVLGRKGRRWSKTTLWIVVATFFLCVTLFLGLFVALVVLANTSWNTQWHLYLQLHQALEDAIPTWVPGSDPGLSPNLLSQLIELRQSSELPGRVEVAVKSLYTAVAFLNFSLATLSVALWLMIRRQLLRHEQYITSLQRGELGSATQLDLFTFGADAINLDVTTPVPSPSTQTSSRTKFSFRSLSNSDTSSPTGGSNDKNVYSDAANVETHRRVRELKRAGAWVLLLGGAIMFASVLMATSLVWSVTLVTVPFAIMPSLEGQSAQTELGLWLFVWVWILIVLPFAGINTLEAWRNLPPKTENMPRSDQDVGWSLGELGSTAIEGGEDRRGSGIVASTAVGGEDSLEAFLRSLEPIPEVESRRTTMRGHTVSDQAGLETPIAAVEISEASLGGVVERPEQQV